MARSEVREAYSAERTAALAGVPLTTVYYWANHGIWEPSVSAERMRFWSLTDLIALRAIYWLRSQEKTQPDQKTPIPRTKMLEVRRTMEEVRLEGLDLTEVTLSVDPAGRVFLKRRDTLARPGGQTAQAPVVLDALRQFVVHKSLRGPDLAQPRPLLRIVPGKLSGEPHVQRTRVRSTDINSLLERGYLAEEVRDFYPFLDLQSIHEAHDLELQLRRNIRAQAA